MNLDQNTRSANVLAKARRWASSFGVVALLLNVIAGPASAGTYDGAMGRTNYVVMTGDVNGDGQNDVLMKAVPKLVMIPIDDDLNVPVPIPAPSPTFALISSSYGVYTLVTNPGADVLANAAWKAATQHVTYAGAAGAFAASVTITATAGEQASFVVSMAADTGLLQITSTTAPAVDTSSGGAGSSSSATPIAVAITPPHLSNENAGTLPGKLEISNSGTATYNIPIVVPPGTAGLQPELSLNYDSSGPNGLVGLGWRIDGLSSIHRCGKTIAQDGVNNRIGFDTGDRLCLDGQRLVLVNLPQSDANYWADTAEYRTEIESFSRIQSQVVNGRQSFIVHAKDGKVRTYGSTEDSYVKAITSYVNAGFGGVQPVQADKKGPQSWALDRIEDRSKNFVSFSYYQDPEKGEHRPDVVRFGGVGLPAHAAVKFLYKDARPDVWKRYIDETRNDLRSRLSHVQTYVGNDLSGDVVTAGTIVREYTLAYEKSPTSGRSLLASIQACARNPQTTAMECLPKTSFASGKPDPSKTPGFESKGMWAGAPILTTWRNTGIVQWPVAGANRSEFFAFADFENRGVTDVLEKRIAMAGPEGAKDELSFVAMGTMKNSYRYFHNNGSGFTQYTYKLHTGEDFAVTATADFDGDGVLDLLAATRNNGVKICLSPLGKPGNLVSPATPIVFTCDPSRPTLGDKYESRVPYLIDIVGDGRTAMIGQMDEYGVSKVCIQKACQLDYNPPKSVLMGKESSEQYVFTNSYNYFSINQSVDFTGIGKPYDVRWSSPSWVSFSDAEERRNTGKWVGLTPSVISTGFQLPGESSVPGKFRGYAYDPAVSHSDGPYTQYTFDHLGHNASSVGDFNGAGYSNLAFGFYTLKQDIAPMFKRAEMTLCLSTGRALDCAVRKKYSGEKYRGVKAVGDFVGDGSPAILVQREPKLTGDGSAYGDLEMCRVMGDDTTNGNGTNDENIHCQPWGGLKAVLHTNAASAIDQIYFMDVLGTGTPQLMYYHSGIAVNNQVWKEDGRWELFAPIDIALPGQLLDRIYQVTNGLGATANVEYSDALANNIVTRTNASTLQYPQHLAPRSGKIASRLSISNGVSAPLVSSYRYEDEAVDAAGRASLGFAAVVSTDEQTNIATRTSYLQTWPYTGIVSSTVIYAGGVKLSETTSSYGVKTNVHTNGNSTVLPVELRSKAENWDLRGIALGNTTITGSGGADISYDAWGNKTDLQVTTILGTESATSTTTDVYFPADIEHWVRPLLKRRDVRKAGVGSSTSITRSVAYTYETDFSGRVKTETIQPDDTTQSMRLVTSYIHNKFGLTTDRTVTWLNPKTANNIVTVDSTGYDDKGRFIISATNALKHTETRTYDEGSGAQNSRTSPNRLVSTTHNDGFGQALVQLAEAGNETRHYRKVCNGDCPLGASIATVSDYFYGVNRIAVPEVVYADSVGHTLRTQTWGFGGAVIVADRSYDAAGRLWVEDQPRFDGATAYLSRRMTYDILNRVTTVETLNDSGQVVINSTEYHGPKSIHVNPNMQKRIELRNVLGKILQVTDADDGVTSFEYDPWGNLTKTTDPRLNRIVVGYDDLGRKTSLRDPDLGYQQYFVDAAGRTWKQINPVMRAKGTFTSFDYDLLGRMTARFEPDLKSYWTFDTATMGVGKIAETYSGNAEQKDYRKLFSYDGLGRPNGTTQVLADGSYTSKPEYDLWGRTIRTTYRRGMGSAKTFDQRYNQFGYLDRVERGSLVLWRRTVQDASGRDRQSKFGNGLVQSKIYDIFTGLERSRSLSTLTGGVRLEETYDYDKLGNVTLRGQFWNSSGFQETLSYDRLNRLSTAQIVGDPTIQRFFYFADGSIRSKTGVGSGDYQYPAQGENAVRPHAVQQIPGINGTFDYDDNGNLTKGAGRSAEWSTFDMPTAIVKGEWRSTFTYGPEHQRTGQTRMNNATGESIVLVYAGNQEVERNGTQVTVKTYWPFGLGVEIDKPGVATQLYWTQSDRLGSPIAIIDSAGNVQEKLAYDVWGKRRTIDGGLIAGTATPDSLDGVIDNRGFTGHEMLDQLDLVHMNGRVYDPSLAKFLSADPYIQDPENGQNYNRYSYVLNNPTNLVDPTGFNAAGMAFPAPPIEQVFVNGLAQLEQMQRQMAKGLQIAAAKSKTILKNAAKAGVRAAARAIPIAARASLVVAIVVMPSNQFQENSELVWQKQQAEARRAKEMAALAKEAKEASDALSADPAGETAGTNSETKGEKKTGESNVRDNNKKGIKAEDEVAADLEGEGMDIDRQVRKETPFGVRIIDIQVNNPVEGEPPLGGIEVKAGDSRYRADQRAKDEWLRQQGYPVDLIRKK